MVVSTYERWSLRKGFNYGDLTGIHLVLWKSGCFEELVPNERWLHMEVQLYTNVSLHVFSQWEKSLGINLHLLLKTNQSHVVWLLYLLAPVQTIFPELNISAVVLGSRILIMTAAKR